MRRIAIIGTAGAGKSLLAASLASLLDAPHVELDALYWLPGWRPRPFDLFQRRVRETVMDERWIVAGNYLHVSDLVWRRADTLIWLDYSLPLVMTRLLRRTVRRVATGEELWGTGNRETLAAALGRGSILRYAWRTHARNRERFEAQLAEPAMAHLEMLRFRSPHALRRWLDERAATPDTVLTSPPPPAGRLEGSAR